MLKGQGEDGEAKVELSGEVPKRERFLCGMRRSMAILLMIALVVVVIVIAGSVGGVLGSRSRSVCFSFSIRDHAHMKNRRDLKRTIQTRPVLVPRPVLRLLRTLPFPHREPYAVSSLLKAQEP